MNFVNIKPNRFSNTSVQPLVQEKRTVCLPQNFSGIQHREMLDKIHIRFGEKFNIQELGQTIDRILGLNDFMGISNNRRMTHSLLVALVTPPDIYPAHSISRSENLRLDVINSIRTTEDLYMDKSLFFALVELAEICTKNLNIDPLQKLAQEFRTPISDAAALRKNLEFLRATDIDSTTHPAEAILAIYAVARNDGKVPELIDRLRTLLPENAGRIRELRPNLERTPTE